MEHLTWIAFPLITLTTDDETDEDSQLTSDFNNWRHCRDCFFLSNGTEACSFKPSRLVLCVSILFLLWLLVWKRQYVTLI